MSKNVRRDKRAPVTLKVRFKSATVDEFIEQYSTDISRGGIFIKSNEPMPVGTLLKFEFKLRDNSPLIQGVGRVVWKRDPEESTDELPPGMGIKFIKMDERSRAIIERIVAGKEEIEPIEEAKDKKSPQGKKEEPKVEITEVETKKETKEEITEEPKKEIKEELKEEAKEKVEEAKEKVEETKEKAEETKEKAEEAKEKAEETKEKAEEAKEKVEETKEKAEEAKEKAEETKEKVEEAKEKVEETKEKAEEAKEKVEETKEKAEETRRKEEEKRGSWVVWFIVIVIVIGIIYLLQKEEGKKGEEVVVTLKTEDGGKQQEPKTEYKIDGGSGSKDIIQDTLTPTPTLLSFNIESEPQGAVVKINGEVKGQTPLTITSIKKDEEIQLTVEKEGFKPVTQSIKVTEELTSQPFKVTLTPLKRVVLIYTEPQEAKVVIDNKVVATTPATLPVELEKLPLTLILKKPGYEDYNLTVNLTDNWEVKEDSLQLTFNINLNPKKQVIVQRPPEKVPQPPVKAPQPPVKAPQPQPTPYNPYESPY